MSAILGSIKNMVDNYGQGMISMQGKLSSDTILLSLQNNCGNWFQTNEQTKIGIDIIRK